MIPIVTSIVANFARDETDALGLLSVDMRKLSDTVVLSGPNGGGKTRVLTLLRNSLTGNRAPPAFRAGMTMHSQESVRVLDAPTMPVTGGGPASQLIYANMLGMRDLLRKDPTNFGNSLAHAQQIVATILWDYLDTFNTKIAPTLVEAELQQRRSHWDSMVRLLDSVMGLHLSHQERTPTIQGRVLDEAFALFSEGQRKLFNFICAFAPGKSWGAGEIVIFDEPEIHLHPRAAIDLLEGMKSVLASGQLWVATHSPMIVAALGWENVWVADSGRVSYAGRNTEKIVSSLLGGADNISSVRALLSEPDRAAISNFMCQCLCEPPIASMTSRDKQFDGDSEAVVSIQAESARLKILDWGAQKGRFAFWLAAQDGPVRARLDYSAYDISIQHREECLRNIELLYGSSEGRHVVGKDCVQALVDRAGKFDCVLISNVLHEIAPIEWAANFDAISGAIDESGHVLIVEDLEIPVGELPTSSGFILINFRACQALFNDRNDAIIDFSCQLRGYESRLKCYVVPRDLLAQVSVATVRAALEIVRDDALVKVQDVRAKRQRGYMMGNIHALHLAQFGNASIALKEFDGR